MDFAEFKNDTEFITSVTNLEKSINAIEKHMALMNELSYEDLSKEDKVKYDLFQTFAINSLFFMYLKLQGIDPSNHGIKHELARIKDGMKREKAYQDRKTMPRIDQDAAKRFVKHELWTPKDPQQDENPSKKRRRD